MPRNIGDIVAIARASSTAAQPSWTPDPDGVPSLDDAYAEFLPPPQILWQTAQRLGNRPAYFVREAQGWVATSWLDYGQQVKDAALALIDLGIQPGQAVAIWSFNRPQWAIMAFAAMAVGATPVGIYWTSSPQDVSYILRHSRARGVMVDDAARLQTLRAIADPLPDLQWTALTPQVAPQQPAAEVDDPQLMSWAQFLDHSRAEHADALDRRLQALRHQDLGTLIYTSGTTGAAKAVALSQGNLWWVSRTMLGLFDSHQDDRAISYLPLAHIAEQIATMHNQAHAGFQVYFARSMDELLLHLQEVRPTVFFGVPRVWEKMQAGLVERMSQAQGIKAALLRWAQGVASHYHDSLHRHETPSLGLRLHMGLARRLVLSKVQRALGLDQARLLSSGAAPIAPEKLQFFTSLDLPVRELYGQSEVSGPSTLSLPQQTRIGSVGKPLPGTQIRVADDGELLVWGPHVFQGYLGSAQATAEALREGWLHTGDLGRIDADGFVYITGRKKDLIITSGGKNISPANLEAALMDQALIEHAVVCGDGRHFLCALLTIDENMRAALAREAGLTPQDLHDEHPALLQALQTQVDYVNSLQARVAQVRKFAVLPGALSVANGELTPTLKVKRKAVLDRHQALIERLYENS